MSNWTHVWCEFFQCTVTSDCGGRGKVLQKSAFPYIFYIKTFKGQIYGECVAYLIVEDFKAYLYTHFIKIVWAVFLPKITTDFFGFLTRIRVDLKFSSN